MLMSPEVPNILLMSTAMLWFWEVELVLKFVCGMLKQL